MALRAEASRHVSASARDVLEFVLDLNGYRRIDHKIVRVGRLVTPDDDGHGSAKVWGRLRWTPPMPDRYDIDLQRWTSLTFSGARRQMARLMVDFEGSFTCDPDGDGVVVTHTYLFTLKGPGRLVEAPHRRWLQTEVDAELDDLAAVLAAGG
jgi:hypothetical protein